MKNLGLNEIREKFLKFFEEKEHLRLKSYPLVPQNDKSLLLINSGMAPLKTYFTGQEVPPKKRVTTCQKCIRTGDIENVGKTARHGTFFEMLGNFSFGDYFKHEIIPWSYEFITKVMEIPEDRLFFSVYLDDDEAFSIWENEVGVPKDRIVRMGKEDNFWEVGLGPCGPCSEIYFDRGEKYGCGSHDCTVGCDCDRYMEFWNLVFTQFCKEEDGSYSDLEHPNIDTGMGLERMAVIMQDVFSLFDVDTIKNIRDKICTMSNTEYGKNPKTDVSIRVITDHIRAITFMTGDGVLPSNEGRGYVLRRLLRRAARHGKLLGINDIFLQKLSEVVINNSKDAYPELLEKKDYIFKVLSIEENKFYETLDQGLSLLKDEIQKLKKDGKTKFSGKEAFKLYDTFGFPIDLTIEMLEEENIELEEDIFYSEMEKQKDRARSAREESTYMGADETTYNLLPTDETTTFHGYTNLTLDNSKILAIISNNEIVNTANCGDEVSIILDNTPFYAESGGQKGDHGKIIMDNGNSEIEIFDCIKVVGNKFAHIGKVVKGTVKTNTVVNANVDTEIRMATARNHTATHLLQKALREVLGNHVEQAGSLVGSDRLRFDFTHFSSLTDEEISKVENLVNTKVLQGMTVEVAEKNIEEARNMGAMALFGEKYGEIVRVVAIEDYSIEFCGGTHISNTSQIGIFKIVSEAGVASGVRRIEALTGKNTLEYFNNQEKTVNDLAKILKTQKDNISKKSEQILQQNKDLQSEIEKLKSKMSGDILGDLVVQAEINKDISFIMTEIDDMDMNGLRTLGDKIRDKVEKCVVLLLSAQGEKVNIICMATDFAVKSGIHCGNIIKATATACGGGGGGKPNMAQAGGKDKSKIIEAIAKGKETAISQI